MTLDCPFRNPLQPRVISVHSCYLTSFWLPLFLQNCHIPHHIRSAFFGTHLFNVFFVTALAVLSSNVRSWLLKGLRIACSGFVVRAYPGAELLGRISDRMWRWVSFPGSGFLAGVFVPFLWSRVLSWCRTIFSIIWDFPLLGFYFWLFPLLTLHPGVRCWGSS